MECFWRLYRHREQDGHCHFQDQAVFYVYFPAHNGFTHYYLYDPGLLEEYAEVYLVGQTQPLVLSLTD